MGNQIMAEKPAPEPGIDPRWVRDVRIGLVVSNAAFWIGVYEIYVLNLPSSPFYRELGLDTAIFMVGAVIFSPPHGLLALPLFIDDTNAKARSWSLGAGLSGFVLPFLAPQPMVEVFKLQPATLFLALYGLAELNLVIAVARVLPALRRQSGGTSLSLKWGFYGAFLSAIYLALLSLSGLSNP
jgi:hypothetical protein